MRGEASIGPASTVDGVDRRELSATPANTMRPPSSCGRVSWAPRATAMITVTTVAVCETSARRFLASGRGLPIHIGDSIIVYVNIKAPTLAPLFRSDAQGEILARLFLNPDRAFTISELARTANTPYASAHREVSRIVKMGLVTTEKRGQAVEVKARRDTPVFRPLAELLGLTYGPPVVIPNYLAGIAGIDEAYIYGSWAARRVGEPGDPPGDIDLLIVGNPPRGEVYDAARVAGAALARVVNPRIVSAAAWKAADTDPFLRTLAERPLMQLDLRETPS